MPEKQDPDVKRILDALERDYLLVSVQFCQWSGLHLAEGTSVLRLFRNSSG